MPSLPLPKPQTETEETKPHYYGHRERLRERLFNAGGEALQDYELLELLLFAAIPRRDVKPLAKQLLTEFKNLWSLLNAKPERLMAFGLSEAAAASIIVTGAAAMRATKSAAIRGPLLNSWQRIVDYCR